MRGLRGLRPLRFNAETLGSDLMSTFTCLLSMVSMVCTHGLRKPASSSSTRSPRRPPTRSPMSRPGQRSACRRCSRATAAPGTGERDAAEPIGEQLALAAVATGKHGAQPASRLRQPRSMGPPPPPISRRGSTVRRAGRQVSFTGARVSGPRTSPDDTRCRRRQWRPVTSLPIEARFLASPPRARRTRRGCARLPAGAAAPCLVLLGTYQEDLRK